MQKGSILTLKDDTQTLPQNGKNHVSDDLKFQIFKGEDAPGTPLQGASPFH